jgi:ParB family chromosome partitioning protein
MATLAERNGYTHEDLAKKLGKSRTAVTETLALHKMPKEVKTLCRLADISSKSLLIEIVRQSDPQKMIAMIERLTRDGHATRQQARQHAAHAKPSRGRPRAYVFSYRPPTKAFKLRLAFARGKVERAEIIAALEGIIAELRGERS